MVSVIIPCYKAERWIAEAIDSCLAQTHTPLEVIVVDDGSPDGSLAVIKSFGDRIRWETGPNRGGNHARNRGFALARGEFIQFLDADDYLLPGKIARQVQCLRETGADVVYGDWRHKMHAADGTTSMLPILESGTQADMLAALLSGWWVAPVAILFHRRAVEKIGGWDESLRAAQDTDFMISLALAGANFAYQPGCDSIYRRYGSVTVGTSNSKRLLDSHIQVLDKAMAALVHTGRLATKYKHALACSFFRIARGYFDIERRQYGALMRRVLELEPGFQPQETRLYNLTRKFLGFQGAEWVAYLKRRLLPAKWFMAAETGQSA